MKMNKTENKLLWMAKNNPRKQVLIQVHFGKYGMAGKRELKAIRALETAGLVRQVEFFSEDYSRHGKFDRTNTWLYQIV